MDQFLQANSNQGTAGAQISARFSGTYSIDSKGTGRVRSVLSNFVPVPTGGFQPLFFFYLTGAGGPALVLDGSDISSALSYPSLGAGIAYPQKAPLTFSGRYGFNITQQNGNVNNGTGQITADTTTSSLSGLVDTNFGFNPTFGNPVSGTFAAPLSNGRFSGSLSSQVFEVSPFEAEYYVIDATQGFFVESDLASPNGPTGVVSFGYYAARTPVCDGCP
jgi:hypothetical protein